MNMYFITNVKISFKTSINCLNTVEKKCVEKDIVCKRYENFIVVKSQFTFIIFKKKRLSNDINHVNATKIQSLEKIVECVNHFSSIFEIDRRDLSNIAVDNITASVNLNKNINLSQISNSNLKKFTTKYHNEIFPGLFLKSKKGTIILFHSGKAVLIGCRNVSEIENLVKNLLMIIEKFQDTEFENKNNQ